MNILYNYMTILFTLFIFSLILTINEENTPLPEIGRFQITQLKYQQRMKFIAEKRREFQLANSGP